MEELKTYDIVYDDKMVKHKDWAYSLLTGKITADQYMEHIQSDIEIDTDTLDTSKMIEHHLLASYRTCDEYFESEYVRLSETITDDNHQAVDLQILQLLIDFNRLSSIINYNLTGLSRREQYKKKEEK